MPVVLAIAGIAVGLIWHWVPGVPAIRVPQGRVLLLFLPPLLTSAPYSLPAAAVRRNIRPMAVLAVGLVLATIVAVAAVAHATRSLRSCRAVVSGLGSWARGRPRYPPRARDGGD